MPYLYGLWIVWTIAKHLKKVLGLRGRNISRLGIRLEVITWMHKKVLGWGEENNSWIVIHLEITLSTHVSRLSCYVIPYFCGLFKPSDNWRRSLNKFRVVGKKHQSVIHSSRLWCRLTCHTFPMGLHGLYMAQHHFVYC